MKHFGRKCALKVINKKKLESNPELPRLMLQELSVLATVRHQNIMHVLEVLEDEDNYYVASEICSGGELFDKILEVKKFSEFDAADIINQVVSGVNYMHSMEPPMVHRDLKPENVLLMSKHAGRYECKLTDFGFACFMDPSRGLQVSLGSAMYMSPELIQRKKYNETVDIWSIGVITFMLLTGRAPFSGKSKEDM